MVAIYGDIQPKDDFTHPLGPETNFNESVYYNFFDRNSGHGGFVRIGNRANEGYAEVTLCLYLPTGEVLFNYSRPQISANDEFDAGGLRVDVLEPFAKHRTVYDGAAVFLADPSQMSDPRQAFRDNPHKRVSLDLTHVAVGPIYGTSGAGHQVADPEKEFASAHYEQHMRAAGAIAIDDQPIQIDGLGLRDHSWGPRFWQAIKSYRWLTCSFSPDFRLMVSQICRTADDITQTGVVIRGDSLQRITSIDLKSDLAPGTTHQRAMTADLTLDNDERLTLEGEVKGFIPLRNRRAGLVTHIGEGMTEYRCAGQVGVGISEYLDQVQ
jgi:hypothetical protein